MVFYRKYRPLKIEDLDSQVIREKLYSVLETNVPHAFLFTGPKGLGKTSTARILAKAVNCEARSAQRAAVGKKSKSQELPATSQIEPCNKCWQCESITTGTNMDVIEIDAASNRGIDEIRDLREKIWLMPLKSAKKVYIIDEVHMLTTEAFNALLKILEEPPEHAIFVLCTTEAHKVPATIISRCFHIPFKKATEFEIARSLKRIVTGENLQVDEDALKVIAKMADGGFREAAKILEEISLIAHGEKITKELFEKSFQIIKIPKYVSSLLNALKTNDLKPALQVIEGLTDDGVDIKYFIAQVLDDLHAKLLKKIGVADPDENEISAGLSFEVEEIKDISVLLSKANQEIKYAVLPQLPLEIAVIEYVSSIKQTHADNSTQVSEDEKSKSDEVTISGLRKQVGTKLKMKALDSQSKKEEGIETAKKNLQADVELMSVPASGEVTREWIVALHKGLIDEMKKYNHTIAGVLRSCTISSFDRKKLVVKAAYKFHKERLDETKSRLALMKACKSLTGNDVSIEVELNNN